MSPLANRTNTGDHSPRFSQEDQKQYDALRAKKYGTAGASRGRQDSFSHTPEPFQPHASGSGSHSHGGRSTTPEGSRTPASARGSPHRLTPDHHAEEPGEGEEENDPSVFLKQKPVPDSAAKYNEEVLGWDSTRYMDMRRSIERAVLNFSNLDTLPNWSEFDTDDKKKIKDLAASWNKDVARFQNRWMVDTVSQEYLARHKKYIKEKKRKVARQKGKGKAKATQRGGLR